jgi:hypothetical protein
MDGLEARSEQLFCIFCAKRIISTGIRLIFAALKLCTHVDISNVALQGSIINLTVANAIDVDSNGTQASSTFYIIAKACVERWNWR